MQLSNSGSVLHQPRNKKRGNEIWLRQPQPPPNMQIQLLDQSAVEEEALIQLLDQSAVAEEALNFRQTRF
jgi:hypothetical protein